MNQLVCEMCGSSDLVKKDGVFVCEHCGCKYSVEEAKKMMVEGTVDVTGSTVKVDNADRLNNLYQIARRARDDNNSENAAKYYDMILIDDPTSWEASFYVVYFKAMSCKIAEIRSAAISISNCEGSVLQLIHDNVPVAEQKAAVSEIIDRSYIIASLLADSYAKHFAEISVSIRANYIKELDGNISAALDIMYTCGNQIDLIFTDNNDVAQLAADAWKKGISLHNRYVSGAGKGKYEEKITKYDKSYESYLNANKKKKLEADIKYLEKQAEEAKNPKIGASLAGGVVFIIFGIVIIIMFIVSGLEELGGMIIIGLAFIIVGIIWIRLKLKWHEKQGKRYKDLTVQIKETEEKLKKLN